MDNRTFSFPIRVYYEDTDCARVVYYANYLKFMERARTEWLRELGWSQENLYEKAKIVFVVVGVTVKYNKPARLDDLLTVKCSLSDCRRATFVFKQEIYRGEELLVSGSVRCAILNAETFRPTVLPEVMANQFKNLIS